jgi:hypothetical protein
MKFWQLLMTLSAFCCVFLMMGCPEEETDDGSGTTDPEGECRKNIDCGAGSICQKENDTDEWGTCLKLVCTSDADCDSSELCDLRRGMCLPENACDPANPQAVCQPGEVCVYEEGLPICKDATTLTPPDSCTISPANIFMATGSTAELHVTGALASGALTPNASFTFSGDTGVTVSENTVTGTCEESSACTVTITATSSLGTASCTATATIYPSVASGDFRVVVFDTQGNAPLAGAKVVARLNDGTTDSQNTGDDGSYTWTGAAVNIEAISAFQPGYQWQTYYNPASADVAIYTSPIADADKVAGVKGKFNYDNVHSLGEIKLGLAGTSIDGSITELNFETLLGEIADTPVNIEGLTSGEEIFPLPSGLAFEVGNEPIKDSFVVFGEPGRRILWAMGGKVKLADVGGIISQVAVTGDDINMGSLLASLLPFFSKFDHSVVTGLDLTETTRPTAPADGTATPYADWTGFTELTGDDAVNLNTLLSQSVTYTVPTLPCAPGKADGSGGCTDNAYSSGVVLLSGTLIPGQGMVPLGLTAGLDDPDTEDGTDQADGKVDHKPGLPGAPSSGSVIVDFAPQHDGLEGNKLATLAIALDIDSLSTDALSASSLVHITDAYASSNSFPTSDFLAFQKGSYNSTSHVVGVEAVGQAHFYRLNLSGGGNGYWNVWFPEGIASIDLDALRTDAEKTGEDSRDEQVDIQAFKLGTGHTGETPTDFTNLVEFNGTNFDNMLFYMGGWSTVTCAAASDDLPSPACPVTE